MSFSIAKKKQTMITNHEHFVKHSLFLLPFLEPRFSTAAYTHVIRILQVDFVTVIYYFLCFIWSVFFNF